MLRLLYLLLVLYLLWRLYLAFRPKLAPRLEGGLRVRPEAPLTPIYYVSGGEGFRQLHDGPRQEAPLTLLEHGTLSEHSSAYVLGSVQNTSGKGLRAVEVLIGLYNERGERLAQLRATHDALGAGDVWAFRAKVTEPSASQYRVLELRGLPRAGRIF